MVTPPSAPTKSSVSAEEVHKRSADEVFPTHMDSVGPDRMWASVRWPETHPFYSDASSGVDSYLLLETIRQLTILACHRHYGTDSAAHFVMPGIGMALVPDALRPRTRPVDVSVRLCGTRVRRSADGTLQSVRLEAEFFDGAVLFATGHGDAMIVNDRVYSRLRGGRTTLQRADTTRPYGVPADPHLIGHNSDSEVVISAVHTADSFTLTLDYSNRVLFDHPLDHIAGMIPIAATRQILRCLRSDPGAELSKAEFRFPTALEFDDKVTVSVTAGTEITTLQFVQAGRTAATCEVTVGPAMVEELREEASDRESRVHHQIAGPRSLRERRISTSRESVAGGLLAP
jgi:hypothetical protein